MKYFSEVNGRSLLRVIVDDKDRENIIVVDENGLKYEFEQLWYKPYRERTYCILCQPKAAEDGTVTKNKFVFYFEKVGHEVLLAFEHSARKKRAVLNDYKNSVNKAVEYGKQRKAQEFGASHYKANVFADYAVKLLYLLVCFITLGLAYPPMICWKMRWQAKRTQISGIQLSFDGKACDLYPKYLLWWFLSVITLGVFYIVYAGIRLYKWNAEHTHFLDEKRGASSFNAQWYQVLGVSLLAGFVSFITLSFGSYWAYCYKERWFCDHTKIDGYQLYFEGTAMEYFLNRLLWSFLTFITFGIYQFWLELKTHQWTTSMTFAEDPNDPANSLLPVPMKVE